MKHLGKVILFSMVLLPVIGLYSMANYWDPLGMCFIKLDGDILKGNEKTIKLALRNIKILDRQSYNDICKYTDKIVEQQCLTSDPHFGFPDIIPKGCYIRGSKIIYLEPLKDESASAVGEREGLIIKHTHSSKQFWLDHNAN